MVSNSTCLKIEQMCVRTISFLWVLLEAQPRASASLLIFGQLARDYTSDFRPIIFSFSLNCILGHHKTTLFSLHFSQAHTLCSQHKNNLSWQIKQVPINYLPLSLPSCSFTCRNTATTMGCLPRGLTHAFFIIRLL